MSTDTTPLLDPTREVDPTLGAGGPERINVGSGPAAIRALGQALRGGLLPDTYVTDGDLVHMETVSGGVGEPAADEDSPLPVAATRLNPANLARLLAEHAFIFKYERPQDGGKAREIEATPPQTVLSPVLSSRGWPGMPTLRGVIGAPVLRRDGTLLQKPGYDTATGLYLATRVRLDDIPEQPTPEQVHAARTFLLEKFLRDFPWSSPADRANYIALFATPVLRHYLRSLVPFGMIDATMPASGKTILTAGPGMLYGQRVLPWPDEDVELRKAITAVFGDPVGCVVFDNIAEGSVIDSPILATLITMPVWTDRLLGASKSVSAVNDRLWMATGNNLQLGGDMASRTVRVRLDPNMPRPEERDQGKFGIPGLDHWITKPANQRIVLSHLLVLVLDWISAGAPKNTHLTMRQFTTWAQALGGFLHHHAIPGFLTNTADVRGIDEDESRWAAFLTTWHDRHGPKPLTAAELRADYNPDQFDGFHTDPWDGTFITAPKSGRVPNAVGLGRLLVGQAGRWRGRHVVRVDQSARGDRRYWVEPQPPPDATPDDDQPDANDDRNRSWDQPEINSPAARDAKNISASPHLRNTGT